MHREIFVRCPNCGNLAKRLIGDRLSNGDSCPGKRLLSTGQKLNGAELGVKERLGRSNEKAA